MSGTSAGDELASRRQRTADDRSHLEKLDYTSFLEALADAERVAVDLIVQVDGELLIPASDVDFLARRLISLVRVCIDEAREVR